MPADTPGPMPPFTTIAPGIYEDANGAAVFNVADILEYLNLADTEKNREELLEQLTSLINQDNAPDTIQVVMRDQTEIWRRHL